MDKHLQTEAFAQFRLQGCLTGNAYTGTDTRLASINSHATAEIPLLRGCCLPGTCLPARSLFGSSRVLTAFLGCEGRSGARRAASGTRVQAGERKRTRKLLLHRYSCPLCPNSGWKGTKLLQLGFYAPFGAQNGS